MSTPEDRALLDNLQQKVEAYVNAPSIIGAGEMQEAFAAVQAALAPSTDPHPCAEAARLDLLDEMEDARLELIANHQPTSADVMAKAIVWIDGETEGDEALAPSDLALTLLDEIEADAGYLFGRILCEPSERMHLEMASAVRDKIGRIRRALASAIAPAPSNQDRPKDAKEPC